MPYPLMHNLGQASAKHRLRRSTVVKGSPLNPVDVLDMALGCSTTRCTYMEAMTGGLANRGLPIMSQVSMSDE